ncbi:MAG TPA: hypothetical protein VF226_16335, partial [Hyphomicrobiaceae bacterium]
RFAAFSLRRFAAYFLLGRRRRMSRSALVAAMVLASACTVFPSAEDVVIVGRVLTVEGEPIPNVTLYYVDLKYRAFSMPGVGASGYVKTNESGEYRIELDEIHDALDIGVNDDGCGGIDGTYALIEKGRFADGSTVVQNLRFCAVSRKQSAKQRHGSRKLGSANAA